MGSREETHHEEGRRKLARLLAGAHFLARACISPESPKLETTRSLSVFCSDQTIVSQIISSVYCFSVLVKENSSTSLGLNAIQVFSLAKPASILIRTFLLVTTLIREAFTSPRSFLVYLYILLYFWKGHSVDRRHLLERALMPAYFSPGGGGEIFYLQQFEEKAFFRANFAFA